MVRLERRMNLDFYWPLFLQASLMHERAMMAKVGAMIAKTQ